MTGSGGMGTLPSSRLTKILQEKAELLKKRRQNAEAALKLVETRSALLATLEITLPESKERESQIRDLTRRSDWENAELQAKSWLDYLAQSGSEPFAAKRSEILERARLLVEGGAELPVAAEAARKTLATVAPSGWLDDLEGLVALDEQLREAEAKLSTRLRSEAWALAEWAGVTAERNPELEAKFRTAIEPIHTGRMEEARRNLESVIRADLPTAVEVRETARSGGAAIVEAAKDLSVPSAPLEVALRADHEASALDWPTTVQAIESAGALIGESLRERVAATIASLRATLATLRDSGVDPSAGIAALEENLSQVPSATPRQLPELLNRSRAIAEEPVVSVVAGLLDEVRPRLVEARRLGRNPSDVFAAMNRAREALRLKIYSEALAASQEAINRVSELTQDLDTAREEADSLGEFLERLQRLKFPVAPYLEQLRAARARLDEVDLPAGRAQLKETVQSLGREALEHFSNQSTSMSRVVAQAQERGFAPPDADEAMVQIRGHLEEGRFADGGEALAALEVKLRTAAGPYVARRVEEISKGFQEIAEDDLTAPVRRLLADADVNLRVKEDLAGCLESLRRAEREFSAVFAAHASSLVDGLEDERKALESMGGAGDEIQRQIDEVQQIFNMGDFLKASRASQEIRTRAHQQQLLRSEDSLSHAKLALVELGKMGLETVELKATLEAAQESARAQRYPEAYRKSTIVLESAAKLKGAAQAVLDGLAESTALFQQLKQEGVPVEPFRDKIGQARESYQKLDFETARATLGELKHSLERERAGSEARRMLGEAELLLEDSHRIGVPTEGVVQGISQVRELLGTGRFVDARASVEPVHTEVIAHLRPILDENLRAVERDLEVARSAGLDSPEVTETIGEARRRLGMPVPNGVAELIETARGQLVETRGFLEHAERAVKRARDAFNQAELVRVDVQPVRARMERAEVHLARKEYPRAIELSAELERELSQATQQQVSKVLAGFQGMLVRVRSGGTDTTLAENLLNQARTALEEGRPLDAIQLAARSEGELERVELQLRIAKGSLETVEGKLGAAVAHGIKAPQAQAQILEGRAAFERREYPAVLESAIAASDLLANARDGHRRARDALDAADRQIKEAMELGAEVEEVIASLDAARAHSESGEYPESIRTARAAAESARWAVERLYSGLLSDLRQLVDLARSEGAEPARLEPVVGPLDLADGALKSREWKRAAETLAEVREAAHALLDELLTDRTRALSAAAPDGAAEAEPGTRRQVLAGVTELQGRHQYALAFQALEEERKRSVELWRQSLAREVAQFEDRLWIGEKLGLDTTPVMEIFTEAKLDLEGGKFDRVVPAVHKGLALLENLVADRLGDRARDLSTELNFAQEGLHVAVGRLPEALTEAERLRGERKPLDAAKIVLESEEELNRRKSLHRELLNIHYLIDAALGRASERHLDAAEARKLLDESIRARASDYSVALEKARQSLALLQAMLKGTSEPSGGFWPFTRPPTD